MTDAPPSAFGSMMASGFAGDHGIEIGVGQPGLQAVDAHEQVRPRRASRRSASAETPPRCRARARLALGRDRIFEIDDDRIGAARHRLVELLGAVGGNEQKGAHGKVRTRAHFGRMRMKAWRRHSATSLLSWL